MENKSEVSKSWFELLGPASIIYAGVYGACVYHNPAGILVLVWAAATIGYVWYVMKKAQKPMKKDSIYYVVAMLLLGISTVTTGNDYIILLNYAVFLFLLVMLLIHNLNDDRDWDIGKNLGMFVQAIVGAIVCVADPAFDGIQYAQSRGKEKSQKMYPILLGAALAIPVLIVIGLLLASADAVFKNLLDGMLGALVLPENIFGIGFFVLFGFLASYCGMRFLLSKSALAPTYPRERKGPMTAIVFSIVLTGMYLLFSVIQIYYLFLGYGKLPENMTYAEYARTGFFQLLFVVMINVVLILLVNKYVNVNRLLRIILLTICGCTYIMIASSCYRMLLYIGAYHLTFLRVFVLVVLAAIAVIMVGVIISLYHDKMPLFRYSLSVAVGFYLIFSLSHVDYWIARYNVAHITESTKGELLESLGELSTDAAFVIDDYLEQAPEEKGEILNALDRIKKYPNDYSPYEDNLVSWFLWYLERNQMRMERSGLREWNLSYRKADQCLNWR